MSDYDDQFTAPERARVEALRILAMGPPITADAMVTEAKVLAEFIAGPEGLVPTEWKRLREVVAAVEQLLKRVEPGEHPWSRPASDVTVAVTVGELNRIKDMLWSIEEPPF